MIYSQHLNTVLMDTPIGAITITQYDDVIDMIRYGSDMMLFGGGIETPLLKEAKRQVQAYFDRDLKRFDLPLHMKPFAEFTQKVYRLLMDVPYGETTTYGRLAALAGSPKAARAVGTAMAGNRLPLIIPCHRVIAANGKISGFAWGVDVKCRLLDFEKGT